MGAVTFPDAEVQTRLQSFKNYKVDQLARHPDFRAAGGEQRVTWSPAFIFRDRKGLELRRWIGWLPPRTFAAELAFVQATEKYRRGDFAGAIEGFDQVLSEASGTALEPETLYWKGTAAFLAGGKDMAALASSWQDLAERFPRTHWGQHAAVIADVSA